jgi:hypothetical protein
MSLYCLIVGNGLSGCDVEKEGELSEKVKGNMAGLLCSDEN